MFPIQTKCRFRFHMASPVHWSLLNHDVCLQICWYQVVTIKAFFFQHSCSARVRCEFRGRQRPLSSARAPVLFIAWEQYTHFLGLQKKSTNHFDHSAWDWAKQVKPRAYAYTNTSPFTHMCTYEKKQTKKKTLLHSVPRSPLESTSYFWPQMGQENNSRWQRVTEIYFRESLFFQFTFFWMPF